MTLLALIHGGAHHGGCWDDTIAELRRRRPSFRVIAIDMPGRRSVPGDLASLTIEQCVTSCCEQITREGREDEDLMIVGHSLAGAVMPGLVHVLGAETVTRAVLVARCVQPPGQSVVDTLPRGLKWIVRRVLRRSPVITSVPYVVIRFFFDNGTSRTRRKSIRPMTCAESASLIVEVPSAMWPKIIDTAWILPTHNRALPPVTQKCSMAVIGGVNDVRAFDARYKSI